MEARDIAAENPQFVLPQWAAGLVARFDNRVLVFVRHVEPGSGVHAVGSAQGRFFGVGLQRAVRIIRVERVARKVGQQRSMPLVGALLGHHVDHAAQGAAELGFEAARLDLDLVDELHLVALTHAAVLDLCDVHAVHQEHVFAVAGAIDLVARAGCGSATGRAPALQRFGARTGSQRNQRLEGASFRKVVNDLLLHGHRDLAL